MKNQYLYLIVVLVVLVIAVLGWYYFSSQGAFTRTSYLYCPFNTSSVYCSDATAGNYSGFLTCTKGYIFVCSTGSKATCLPNTGQGSGKYLQCDYTTSGGGGCGPGCYLR